MNIAERIKLIRRQKNLKLTDVHRVIKKIFGDAAVTYRTLQRIEADEPGVKDSSLYQVCVGLDLTRRELKGGGEGKIPIAEHTRRHNRYGRHYFDKNTYAETLSGPNELFTAMFYLVKSGKKIQAGTDADKTGKTRKWLFMLKGTITAAMGEKRFKLVKGDSFSFDGANPYYLKNTSHRDASFILIQYSHHAA